MIKKAIIYGVVSSLIASAIFLYFLDPLIQFLWGLITNSYANHFENYTNSVFLMAAKNYSVDFLSGIILALIPFGFCVMFIVFTIDMTISTYKYHKNNPQDKSKKKFHLIFNCVFMLFIFLYYLPSIPAFYKPVAASGVNTIFNQRLNAIAPYIEPIEEKRLRSSWALMKNKEDYDNINKRLEEFAKNAQIQLPEASFK